MKRKGGYQSKSVEDHKRELIETFLVTERQNKKEGIRLPRKLLAGAEQSLQEFRIPIGHMETRDGNTKRLPKGHRG